MRVAVIGQGYVGLTISSGAISAGFEVIGIDKNRKVVESLNSGKSHIEGISDEKVASALSQGKFKASVDFADITDFEIVVIAVPTPLNRAGEPDLSLLESAIESIAPFLGEDSLVINESTSYIGTLRNVIAPQLTSLNSKVKHFAVSPERVDPGNKSFDVKNTPRLVGGLTEEASNRAVAFYSSFSDHVVKVSSPEIAESAKIFENTFRQVNIALVNEFIQIADALGISGREALEAAATKPFGFMEFNPGPGVGGHCIPVDPSYLAHVANQAGVPASFIKLANTINLAMPEYVVKRAVAGSGGTVIGKKVVVVGVSYKSNVADTRETPAALIIDLLRQQGALVTWHDELVNSWRGESSSPIAGSDIAILVTKHEGVSVDAINSCGYVFDCTGSIAGADGV